MRDHFEGRSVLVTGGAGFIGSLLVEELLEKRAKVSVVDNLSTGSLDNLKNVIGEIQFSQLDLLTDDLAPLFSENRFGSIFHLAGNVDVPYSVENPRYDFDKNARTTLNILLALRENPGDTQFIYTSSAAVYGRGAPTAFKESDPTLPIAPYGVSKLTGEHYTRTFASLYGLKTACLRLFAVYGPRLRRQVVYDLIQKLLQDPSRLFIHGDGTQVRDLNFVGNVVDAHLRIAERGEMGGEIYNVGSGESVTIRRLAEMICERMQLSPKFEFSGQVRPGDAQHWTADLSRLVSIGYSPAVSLSEGLKIVIRWCRHDSEADVRSG